MEEFLKPLGMTQVALTERIGVSFPRVNELVRGKRGVTPDTALRLERLFGMEAQFWLKLRLARALYQATHSPAAKAIRKIRRLPAMAAVGAEWTHESVAMHVWKVESHDKATPTLFEAIHQLMPPPTTESRSIGFRVEERQPVYCVRRRRRAT